MKTTAAYIRVPESNPLPMCEQKLQYAATTYKSASWRKSHNNRLPNACHCHATIFINGKHLCRRHAASEALDLMLKESLE